MAKFISIVNPDFAKEMRKGVNIARRSQRDATKTAINRSLTPTRNFIVGEIQEVISKRNEQGPAASVTGIKKAFTLKKATVSKLEGVIISKGKGLPLIFYGARQTALGVTVRTFRGIRRWLAKGAFITKVAGFTGQLKGKRGPTTAGRKNRKGVFKRAIKGGKRVGRLPIKAQFGPSIPTIEGGSSAFKRIMDFASQNISKLYDRELDRLLRKRLKAV